MLTIKAENTDATTPETAKVEIVDIPVLPIDYNLLKDEIDSQFVDITL